ncbi:unnamed protein product [Lepeophtheirus salmonis]|uniref:(salmon louse) hypothetical protein n=1 Tax=Lepeophtheirus salmonis TaxID=72036 RepID=A0A7R8HBH1_LEPSM|nr:unnamed protein product [Lepeophtheirus salmonis]CAF2994470.1 unnamed protein product [Lepeophtheirus salmonis]
MLNIVVYVLPSHSLRDVPLGFDFFVCKLKLKVKRQRGGLVRSVPTSHQPRAHTPVKVDLAKDYNSLKDSSTSNSVGILTYPTMHPPSPDSNQEEATEIPFPNMKHFSQCLVGSHVFSELCLCKAYQQFPVESKDAHKTDIVNPVGLFNCFRLTRRRSAATVQSIVKNYKRPEFISLGRSVNGRNLNCVSMDIEGGRAKLEALKNTDYVLVKNKTIESSLAPIPSDTLKVLFKEDRIYSLDSGHQTDIV